jgi:cytochrome c oxidase cbb3-type subunit I/II
MAYDWHRPLERESLRFTLWTALAIAVGGLVLLVPPFFLQGTVEPVPGVRPYTALEQEGRDIYIREGCSVCHSQMIRPLRSETARYGHWSRAGESAYDRPFLFGSRRTGPDLARVGGKYPDSWHWLHFMDPRQIEPRSNMPSFAFLSERRLDLSLTRRRLEVLRTLGAPYSDREIEHAVADAERDMQGVAEGLRAQGVELSDAQARSETIALIAYVQHLGRAGGEAP